jgi:hypothetical protein
MNFSQEINPLTSGEKLAFAPKSKPNKPFTKTEAANSSPKDDDTAPSGVVVHLLGFKYYSRLTKNQTLQAPTRKKQAPNFSVAQSSIMLYII